MKLKLFYFLLIFSFYNSFSQLVLNNGVIVNMNGGTSNSASATLVLNTPPATPIKRLGTTTSQGIMLESEWNRIQYNLSTGTTAITVPYISNATGTFTPFPLTVSAITAGVNAGAQPGAIRFSSKRTAGALNAGWDNSTYKPSQVLNVCDGSAGCPGQNNSANIIDRFWIIEPVYYSTRPAVTLGFTYLMMEADPNGVGNTASLSAFLQPQRFDTLVANSGSSPIWGWNGFPSTAAEQGTNAPFGSSNPTDVGTLTGVTVSAANFFPDWTLANYLLPLPVEIINYTGVCENTNVTLKWTSTHETNGAYYSIDKSADGINFSPLANVSAAGTGNNSISYTYIDVSPGDNALMYYRLSETDQNGTKKTYKTLAVSGCNTSITENGTIYAYDNNVNINLFSLSDQNVTVNAYDVTGRLVYQNQLFVNEGNNILKFNPGLAQGIYVFELATNKISLVKRILIENK